MRVNSGITYNRLTGKQQLKLIEAAQKDYESEATRRIQKQQCMCPGELMCEAQPREEVDAVEDDWDKPLPTTPITQYVTKRPQRSPSRSPNKNNFPASSITYNRLTGKQQLKLIEVAQKDYESEATRRIQKHFHIPFSFAIFNRKTYQRLVRQVTKS